jgi:hypothetical protein
MGIFKFILLKWLLLRHTIYVLRSARPNSLPAGQLEEFKHPSRDGWVAGPPWMVFADRHQHVAQQCHNLFALPKAKLVIVGPLLRRFNWRRFGLFPFRPCRRYYKGLGSFLAVLIYIAYAYPVTRVHTFRVGAVGSF